MNLRSIAEDAIVEAVAEDAMGGWEKQTALADHDRRYHPDGYEEGQFCRYREAMSKDDSADNLAAAEAEEDRAINGMKKYMARLGNLGSLILTYPDDDKKYEAVLNEYGIDNKHANYSKALATIKDACEEYKNDGDVPGDEVGELKSKVLAVDSALKNLVSDKKPAQQKKTATTTQPVSPKTTTTATKTSTAPSQQEVADLGKIRDAVESVARLLNGRAGNMQALQSSSRWKALQALALPNNPVIARVDALTKSSDNQIAGGAKKLKGILDGIVKSSQNGWKDKVPNVPSWEDL